MWTEGCLMAEGWLLLLIRLCLAPLSPDRAPERVKPSKRGLNVGNQRIHGNFMGFQGVGCCSWIGATPGTSTGWGDKMKSSPARKDLEVLEGWEGGDVPKTSMSRAHPSTAIKGRRNSVLQFQVGHWCWEHPGIWKMSQLMGGMLEQNDLEVPFQANPFHDSLIP